MLPLEPGHAQPDVLRRERRQLAQRAGEEPARQRAEGDARDAQLPARVQHGDLDVARPQRVLALDRRHRMDAMRPANRRGRHLAQPDGPDLALAHEVGQGTDAVFHRHALVPAVEVVEVDDVGLQARQALFAVAPDGLGPPVDLALACRVAEHAALAREHDPVAVLAERGAEERSRWRRSRTAPPCRSACSQGRAPGGARLRPPRAAAACRRRARATCTRGRGRRRRRGRACVTACRPDREFASVTKAKQRGRESFSPQREERKRLPTPSPSPAC